MEHQRWSWHAEKNCPRNHFRLRSSHAASLWFPLDFPNLVRTACYHNSLMDLSLGSFQKPWKLLLKTTVINHLLKNSLDATVLNNCWPSSNLLTLDRILERVANQVLLTFFCSKFQWLSVRFLCSIRALTLLRQMTSVWIQNQPNTISVLVLLDLSAVFDHVFYYRYYRTE